MLLLWNANAGEKFAVSFNSGGVELLRCGSSAYDPKRTSGKWRDLARSAIQSKE